LQIVAKLRKLTDRYGYATKNELCLEVGGKRSTVHQLINEMVDEGQILDRDIAKEKRRHPSHKRGLFAIYGGEKSASEPVPADSCDLADEQVAA
jgi:hypothetical protein